MTRLPWDCWLTLLDIGKPFHLGVSTATWRVTDIMESHALCNMVGTDDFIRLPQEKVAELIADYENDYNEYMNLVHGDI